MAKYDDLKKKLSAEINRVIADRVRSIRDQPVRQAVEETLREQVYENIADILSGKTVQNLVDDSMHDILSTLQGSSAYGKGHSYGGLQRSFGGKSDSGGKDSPGVSPSGGKDSGGKETPRRPDRFRSGGKSGPGGK